MNLCLDPSTGAYLGSRDVRPCFYYGVYIQKSLGKHEPFTTDDRRGSRSRIAGLEDDRRSLGLWTSTDKIPDLPSIFLPYIYHIKSL